MKLLVWTIATTAFVLASSEVVGEVGPTRLEWIISNADIVAVGRDGETVSSGEWLLAVFEIEEAIIGDVGPGDRVVYVAEPTWTCDDSRASVGQKALLFLTKSLAVTHEQGQNFGHPNVRPSLDRSFLSMDLYMESLVRAGTRRDRTVNVSRESLRGRR